MKRMTKIAAFALLAGTAVTLAVPNVAAAHGAGKGGPDGKAGFMNAEFTDFDANGNGQITVEDLQAKAQERFRAADTDGDGNLSKDEMVAQAKTRMAERMEGKGEAQNKRGPGPEKRAAWMIERMIEKRDANNDGMLSLEEMTPAQGMERLIDRFDTDDDNAISEAEFDAAQKEMFGRRGGKGGHGKRRN